MSETSDIKKPSEIEDKKVTKPQPININNLTKEQSLSAIWQLLNKAQSKGAFTIDESVIIKYAIEKLQREILPQEKPSE